MYYVYLDGPCKTTIIDRTDSKEEAEKIKTDLESQVANVAVRIIKKEFKKN